MVQFLPITDVYAREIFDSQGNPAIEVEVVAGGHPTGLSKRQRPYFTQQGIPASQKQNTGISDTEG